MIEEGTSGWLDALVEELEGDPDYIASEMAIGLMEEACRLMEAQGVSRAELAQRMGVNRARVTQLLNAAPNLTLRSVAQLAIALGARPHVSLLDPCPSKEPATIGHQDLPD
jgi:antitoxin component HigA of HigAB toxin-antitoxin module